MQDAEAVLELLVQRGEAGRALAVLRQPHLSRELAYKFAPPLMAAGPAATVRTHAPDNRAWKGELTGEMPCFCPSCTSQMMLGLGSCL